MGREVDARNDWPPDGPRVAYCLPRVITESESVLRVQMGLRLDPRALFVHFVEGHVPLAALGALLAESWTTSLSPLALLASEDWMAMFDSLGYFSYPFDVALPDAPVLLHRGASLERAAGMSWVRYRLEARYYQSRALSLGAPAAGVYAATFEPSRILACFHRPHEGWTVVVDPQGLEPTLLRPSTSP